MAQKVICIGDQGDIYELRVEEWQEERRMPAEFVRYSSINDFVNAIMKMSDVEKDEIAAIVIQNTQILFQGEYNGEDVFNLRPKFSDMGSKRGEELALYVVTELKWDNDKGLPALFFLSTLKEDNHSRLAEVKNMSR